MYNPFQGLSFLFLDFTPPPHAWKSWIHVMASFPPGQIKEERWSRILIRDVSRLWTQAFHPLDPSTLDATREAKQTGTWKSHGRTALSTLHAPCNVRQNGTWLHFFASHIQCGRGQRTEYPAILGPNPHRTRRDAKEMEPIDVNGSVYTACKQHQRKNVPICVRVASRVLCGLGLDQRLGLTWSAPRRRKGAIMM